MRISTLPLLLCLGRAIVPWIVALISLPTARAEGGPPRGWHVEFVLDQSGSMRGPDSSDPDANALVAPMILADISGQNDIVTIVPQESRKHADDPFTLNVAHRDEFRARVVGMRNRATGSSYQASLERAVSDLVSAPPDHEKAAIVVYDGDQAQDLPGTEFHTAAELRRQLDEVRAHPFVLAMGRKALDRPLTRAFDVRLVNGGDDLLSAFGHVFREIINAKQDPPSGRSSASGFELEIPSGARDAWLFVLARGAVRSVDVVDHPGGDPTVDAPSHAVWTSEVKDLRRGYRGIRLTRPTGGRWRFAANTDDSKIDWMLLPVYDVEISVDDPIHAIKGSAKIPVSARLGDGAPLDLKVEATVAGKTTRLNCADHKCSGEVDYDGEGPVDVKINASSDTLDVSRTFKPSVDRALFALDCSMFQGTLAAVGSTFMMTHRHSGTSSPAEVWVESPSGRAELVDTGGGEWRGSISLEQPGKHHIKLNSRVLGTVYSCEADMDVRPCAGVKMDLPEGPLVWGPCGASPDATCEKCGGGCSGIEVPFSLAGIPEGSQARLSLGEELPGGVTAWLGERRLERNSPVEITKSASEPLSLRLCSSECPVVAFSRSLALRVEVPEGLDCQAMPLRLGAFGEGKTAIAPREASFWACNKRKIYWILAGALLIFILYGFIRPLKFPKASGGSDIPYSVTMVQATEIHRISSTNPLPLFSRPNSVKGFWWSHQEAHLVDLMTTLNPTQAQVSVCLVKEVPSAAKSEGATVPSGGAAWISSRGGSLRRTKTPARAGARMGDYKWETVKPYGEQLQCGCIYYVTGGKPYVIVFNS